MSDTALEVTELRRDFGGIRALDGVHLAAREGERLAVIGPNGAGKTTLFNVLTGEIPPTAGRVILGGRDVTGMSAPRRARHGLARMYQKSELFDGLTARENVAISVGAARGPYRLGMAGSSSERSAADRILDRVGLSGRGGSRPRALSHGERRQLELALALARDPRVLLLDEPTAGMSPAETQLIAQLIAGLERTLTLLIVEHDMDVVFRLADRIAVLHEGKVIADGTPAQIRGDRVVNDVYLGRVVEA